MKKVLIISPHFAPVNTADMQRVRMSLPYFKLYNWEAEVVTVDPKFIDISKDELLLVNLPAGIKIHKVNALPKNITRKVGLGSTALRSLWYYKNYVNQLLQKEHFDLIYFSTTEFPVLILGSYWKKKFKIPYVFDMQDPWHSTYYQDKPKAERPAKYWFSYRLNKFLEPIAMRTVDGLISVSKAYIETLTQRYPRIRQIPTAVITFGAFKKDFELVKKQYSYFKPSYDKDENFIHIVYVGRGGNDMKGALSLLFKAFIKGLDENQTLFSKIRFHFIGTSYAPNGEGKQSIKPIATRMGIEDYVYEQTDRISFYDSIYTLSTANGLVIIGSDDPQYTASKIYPYILAEKPLLAFFHPDSSAAKIISACNAGIVIPLSGCEDRSTIDVVYQELYNLVSGYKKMQVNWLEFERYSANNMTKLQCKLFNKIIS